MRGRIRLPRLLIESDSVRRAIAVEVRYDEFTEDILENRLIRAASFERHGKATTATVLFDMNAVIEDFVRTALRGDRRLRLRRNGEFRSGLET